MIGLPPGTIIQMMLDECVLTSDQETNDTARKLMPLWWQFYNNKRGELQYWYARRSLLMYLQAKARWFVDTQTGPDRVANNQFFKNITKMLEQADNELNILDSNRGAATLTVVSARTELPDTLHEQLEILRRGLLTTLVEEQGEFLAPGLGYDLP